MFAAFAVVATAACASAPVQTRRAVPPALEAEIPKWLAKYNVPGVAVAHIEDGRVGWVGVYGMQASGVPATPSTLYNVASLTKPVFAEIVLHLVAQGAISLDEPLARYWIDPDLAHDARHNVLTPRIVLTHRTGFANWRRETGGVLRFRAEPGRTYGYSGEGYEYLARAITKKSGASLDSLARQTVLRKFGMSNTAFTPQPWFNGRVAAPMGSDGKFGKSDFSATGNAADDIHTTIGDYAAFVIGVMNRTGLPRAIAQQRDSIHVEDASPQAACDPQKVRRCPLRIGHGLGWSIVDYGDDKILWHTGADWGEKAMAFFSTKRKEGLVVFANGANGFEVIADIALFVLQGEDFGDYLRSKANR